jgi:tripartite ATP-independent transporter DctP family solute receptor
MIRTYIAGFIVAGATVLTPAMAESLRLSHHHAVGGHLDQTAAKFAELVSAKTNGEVTVEVFPAAQLAQEREGVDLLDQGIVDMTITSLALMDRFWQPVAVTSLPFAWKSWEQADRALAAGVEAKIAEGVMANSNIQILGIIGGGFRDMVFRGEPVTTIAGMKGMKMRSPEAHLWIRMFELIGASPTPVTWGEIYTAMQTGVAEGLEAPALSVTDAKLHEVMKSAVTTNHMFLTYALNINENKFASLSDAHKAAVIDAGKEASAWSNEFAKKAIEQAYEIMKASGMTIAPPSNPAEWPTAMRPMWDESTADKPEAKALLDQITSVE